MRQKDPGKVFTRLTASAVIGGAVMAIIGGLFAAEGLLGYFYNSSMFLEGLNHVWEIVAGLETVIYGSVIAAYAASR